MGAIKNYMMELAEHLDKDFDQISQSDMELYFYEVEYIKYLKTLDNKDIQNFVSQFESRDIGFQELIQKINPSLHEGVVSFHVFQKDDKIDNLLK